jgi:hypothetical protein
MSQMHILLEFKKSVLTLKIIVIVNQNIGMNIPKKNRSFPF